MTGIAGQPDRVVENTQGFCVRAAGAARDRGVGQRPAAKIIRWCDRDRGLAGSDRRRRVTAFVQRIGEKRATERRQAVIAGNDADVTGLFASPARPRWAKLRPAAAQCRWCPALPFLRIDSTQMLAGSTCRPP